MDVARRYYGLYRGVVFDNSDTDGLGRLRVKIPQIMGNEPTGWVWPVNSPGLVLTPPPVGQGVWIQFEGGDPSFPIWTGVFGTNVSNDTYIKVATVQNGDLSLNYLSSITEQSGSVTVDLVRSVTNIAMLVDGGSA
jgi:hypothetical protein